jgi:hypothetical protein
MHLEHEWDEEAYSVAQELIKTYNKPLNEDTFHWLLSLTAWAPHLAPDLRKLIASVATTEPSEREE